MTWLQKLSLVKKLLLILSQAIIIACVVLWVFFNKQEVDDQNKVLISSLESLLPQEAKGKVFISHSLQSKQKPMVSSVFTLSQYKQKDIPSYIGRFMLSASSYLKENNYVYSAVVITILIVETNEQFRIVLGNKVQSEMPPEAFKNQGNLFSWLEENCARTDATDLEKYCHITKNLKGTP